MSVTSCVMRKINSCEAKVNWEGKLLNAWTRLDSVVGVLSIESYNDGTLPSHVQTQKMEHGNTAEIIFCVVRC